MGATSGGTHLGRHGRSGSSMGATSDGTHLGRHDRSGSIMGATSGETHPAGTAVLDLGRRTPGWRCCMSWTTGSANNSSLFFYVIIASLSLFFHVLYLLVTLLSDVE